MLDDKRPGDKSVADLKRNDNDNDAGLRPNDTQNVVVVDKGGEGSSAPSVAVPSTGWHLHVEGIAPGLIDIAATRFTRAGKELTDNAINQLIDIPKNRLKGALSDNERKIVEVKNRANRWNYRQTQCYCPSGNAEIRKVHSDLKSLLISYSTWTVAKTR